jgi:hypothetical protein
MALPVFRAASAKAASTTAATPALPAGSVADDIVLLVATTDIFSVLSITANGSIGTWTQIFDDIGVANDDGDVLYAWWGRYVSGATGPTVTTDGDHVCAATVGYSGCSTGSDVIHQTATGTENTSDTSFSFATGVSTSVADCMCIGICTSGADSNTGQVPVMANTSLAALASRLNINTNLGGGGGFGLTEGTRAVAGSMGTWTATLGGATRKAYGTIALRPPDPLTEFISEYGPRVDSAVPRVIEVVGY